jgi:hypothetical protein
MAKTIKTEQPVSDKKEVVKDLLKKKLPAVFEREPAPAYNSNLDKLVDELVELLK